MHERLTHFREILRYVPRFRDRVFVIAIDGAIVEDDNFPNLLLDIALLRSLSIRVVLVHGAAHQIRRYAELTEGRTLGRRWHRHHRPGDAAGRDHGRQPRHARNPRRTLRQRPARRVPQCHRRAPAGILGGVDHLFTGNVERVDVGLLQTLLEHDIIPVVPPIGIDGTGNSFRLNSDAVAVEVAKSLRAVKLIYLTTEGGVRGPKGVVRQMTVQEAEAFLKKHRGELPPGTVTKLTTPCGPARKASSESTSSTAASRKDCSAKSSPTRGSAR